MCRFIKENGERCEIEQEPFCHMHEETPQSHFYHSMEELKGDLAELKSLWQEYRSEDESGRSGGFEPEWTPTTCDECDGAVRVVCARIDEAAFNPRDAVPMMALTCRCGDSVQWNPDWDTIPKSELPAKWLFPSDRLHSWDSEEERILDSKRLVEDYNEEGQDEE